MHTSYRELLRSWFQFGVELRTSLFAGVLLKCNLDHQNIVQSFPMPVLGQANNPRRLVLGDDDSVVNSCSYPYSTLLGGIRRWVRRDRLSFSLHRLMVSRYCGESASPLHLGARISLALKPSC